MHKSLSKEDRNMTTYGYARVSTNGQDLGSQEVELMAAGCAKVFKEKVSGAKTDRAELAKVMRRLEPGDVLVVARLDRLARSTRDLLNVLATIGERGAGFRSLKDTRGDTTTPHGRLMLTVLGGLAEFERELIRARTSDGRAGAKARGASWQWRGASRRCTVLCCQPSHDLAACSLLTAIRVADLTCQRGAAATIGKMLLISPVLIAVVLFYWFAFCFTLWAWFRAIVCLCECKFIRASLWFNAGVFILFWWFDKPHGWN